MAKDINNGHYNINCRMIIKKKLITTIILVIIICGFFPSNTIAEKPNQDIKHLNIYENNLTFYFANASITYTKNKENGDIYFNKHTHVHAQGYGLHFDVGTEDITMKLIMNYTGMLNYTTIGNRPYHLLKPLIAFGLREKNYTDYTWESFKLKRHGNEIKEGNISIEFTIETEKIQPGDEIIINPEIYIIGDPLLRISNESIKTSWVLRLAYTFPIFNKIILHNKILPQYAPDNYKGGSTFILYFH